MIDKRLKVCEDVIFRDEDKVLFHTRKNLILECNEIAYDVIKYLKQDIGIKDIINALNQEYDSNEDEIYAAVFEFIEMCIQDNVIIEVL